MQDSTGFAAHLVPVSYQINMFGRINCILLLCFLHQRDKITVYGIGKQYIGCCQDGTLRTGRLDHKLMTNDMCVSHCCSFLDDATFMGTQAGYKCFCSNVSNPDNFIQRDPFECNMTCEGNSGETCGGTYSLSLHKIGCSTDTTVLSLPQTRSDRSTIIQEMTTESTVAVHLPSTTSLAQFTLTSSVGGNNSVCSCANCWQINNTVWTEEELAEKVSLLRNAISINKKETNSFKATKISAYDPRKSSRHIGIVGVIVLVVPVIVVVIVDVQRICQ